MVKTDPLPFVNVQLPGHDADRRAYVRVHGHTLLATEIALSPPELVTGLTAIALEVCMRRRYSQVLQPLVRRVRDGRPESLPYRRSSQVQLSDLTPPVQVRLPRALYESFESNADGALAWLHQSRSMPFKEFVKLTVFVADALCAQPGRSLDLTRATLKRRWPRA
jgi:hypothetical protein